jgi:hypothetical protein
MMDIMFSSLVAMLTSPQINRPDARRGADRPVMGATPGIGGRLPITLAIMCALTAHALLTASGLAAGRRSAPSERPSFDSFVDARPPRHA